MTPAQNETLAKLPDEIEAEVEHKAQVISDPWFNVVTEEQWDRMFSLALGELSSIARKVAEDCAAKLQAVANVAQISNSNEALFFAKAAQLIRERYGLDEPAKEETPHA